MLKCVGCITITLLKLCVCVCVCVCVFTRTVHSVCTFCHDSLGAILRIYNNLNIPLVDANGYASQEHPNLCLAVFT
jgi:hypothetical protein